jgi:hypothetical protein
MELKNSILKVLVYYELFEYPLLIEEIYCFLDKKVSLFQLRENLEYLTKNEFIYKIDRFYSLRNDRRLVDKRMLENSRAQSLLLTANKISQFLFRFPFVRGIGISGSLSKNVAGKNADIDYFIITKANRLWIARTIMHFFKKFTFITGHQHWYCMNYYIDEEQLQIEEKNIFIATELMTLIPVCGNESMNKFFHSNDWAKTYFPNYGFKGTDSLNTASPGKIKRLIETVFNNNMGDLLDNYFMNLTTRRWISKEKKQKLNAKGNRMGLKTSKHYCKPNPAFFHEKLLARFNSRLNEWENIWKITAHQPISALLS